MQNLDRHERAERSPSLGRSGRTALSVFVLVAAYFLGTEHRAHVIQYLPWGLLALCPLMHLFMHRGHASHGVAGSDPGAERRRPGA